MMDSLSIDLPLVLGASLTMLAAGIFAAAAQHKLRNFTEFTGFVAGYRLLPRTMIRPASSLIVLLECGAVAGALAGIAPFAFLPAMMLLLYALAMAINLARGRTDVDCGCGGTPMPLSLALVARNLTLALAFLWASGTGGVVALASMSPGLLPIAAGCAICLGVLYAAFNQLQANRGIHQRLWRQTV